MAEIILNGLSDELLPKIDELISKRLEETLQKLKAEQEEKLLSVDACCSLFVPKVSRQTLDNWCNAGYIQKHCIGRSIWFKKSEIFEAAKSLNKILRIEKPDKAA